MPLDGGEREIWDRIEAELRVDPALNFRRRLRWWRFLNWLANAVRHIPPTAFLPFPWMWGWPLCIVPIISMWICIFLAASAVHTIGG